MHSHYRAVAAGITTAVIGGLIFDGFHHHKSHHKVAHPHRPAPGGRPGGHGGRPGGHRR